MFRIKSTFKENMEPAEERIKAAAKVVWGCILFFLVSFALLFFFLGCKAEKNAGPVCFPGAEPSPSDHCR